MRSFARVAAAMAVLCSPARAKDRVETVAFARGEAAATIRGSLQGYDGVLYRLAVVNGQAFHMLFAPTNLSCYVNVYAPGQKIGRDEAAFIGSTSGNEFGVNPAKAGVYLLQVYLMRNAARRNETCRYRLSMELTGAPGGASAGVSDQSMIDECKGAAAQMYGVEPRNVAPAGKIAKAAKSGFTLEGKVEKGVEGIKKLRCIYRADRRLDHIQAMTSDGE